jgi:hypothetical protein
MFKKALSKLKKVSSRDRKPEAETAKSSKNSSPTPRLLTAEGWKRLMMKKYRKSS